MSEVVGLADSGTALIPRLSEPITNKKSNNTDPDASILNVCLFFCTVVV